MIHYFKRNKFQLFLGMLSIIRSHYIFVLFFSCFLLNPSFSSLICSLLIFIFNHLLINIVFQLRSYITLIKINEGRLKRYISENGNIKLKKNKISDFTGNEVYESISSVPLFNLTNKIIDKSVHIYTEVDNNNSNLLFTNVVCFARPFLESYIFIDVSPSEINSFIKFKVFHEIGHSLVSPFLIETKRQGGILTFIGFILITVYFFDLTLIPWYAVVFYILMLIIRLISAFVNWFKDDLIDEICADLFALSFISDEDRDKISKMNPKVVNMFFKNQKLLKIQQKNREIIFWEFLKKNTEGNEDEAIEFAKRVMQPSLYKILIKEVFWIFFYATLSYFLNPLQKIDNYFLIKVIAIIFIIFVILYWINSLANREIKNILASLEC